MVFQENSKKFTNAFQVELSTNIMDILKSYSQLTQKEIIHWKSQFSKEAEKHLDLRLNKKAYRFFILIEYNKYLSIGTE